MLHIIYGRAGFGKTRYVWETISTLADMQAKVLLVPEQYSFESERMMLSLPLTQRAEVYSFSRLSEQMHKQYGQIAGNPLGTVEKQLLTLRAVNQVADRLQIYRRQAQKREFIGHLAPLLQEFSYAGVDGQALAQVAQTLGSSSLQKKMEELSLIASAYESLKAESYIDPEGDLSLLFDLLEQNCFWQDKTVFVDGFKGFTVPQMKLVKQMILRAKDVYITVCADGMDQRYQMDVFANTKMLAKQLIRYAKENGVACTTVQLTENHRAENAGMTRMEQVLADKEDLSQEDSQSVMICACKDKYDEGEFVASTICRLVRKEGFRFRDIAVIARDAAPYYDLLEDTFARYEIPFFTDRRRPIDHQPLTAYLLGGVELAVNGWDTDGILSVLKTGLSGLSMKEIAALENYAFVWSVKGKGWLTDFCYHPEGRGQGEPDSEQMQELNRWRRKAVLPLYQLANRMKECATVQEYCIALHTFLEDNQIYTRLTENAGVLQKAGDVFEAEDLVRCYEVWMGLLESVVAAVGDLSMDGKEFTRLLQSAAKTADMGKIPQGIDQVTVGSADRIRPASPKAVFLLGTNQGVFPATPASGGLLTDRDRAILRQNEIPISDRMVFDAVEERYLFYAAACCASHRAYFSYLITDGEKELSPAGEVEQLKNCLPSCRVYAPGEWAKEDPLSRGVTLSSAFGLLAEEYAGGSVLAGSLYEYFSRYHPERLGILHQLTTPPDCRLSPEHASQVFGEHITISPSGIEVYHKCGFSYFCQYGLRVSPRKPVALDVLSRGTMVHYVLEQMLKRHGSRGLHTLEEDQLRSTVHTLLYDYVEETMGAVSEKAYTFRFQLERMEMLLVSLLSHMAQELKDSYFEMAACEWEIKRGGQMEPVTVDLPDGGSLTVRGTVDRVDTYHKDGITYFRVVDYKTGVKTFELDDIYYGIGLQMLIYLFAVEKNGTYFGDHRVPAGVLYVPARRVSKRTDGDESKLQKELSKSMQMNGLVLDDPIVLQGMDPKRSGIYVPFSFKKDGTASASSSLASLEFFGKIRKQIETLLYEMGEHLQQGEITCDPLDPVGKDACQYCEYKAACPALAGQPHRKVPSLTKAQEKELLQGGDYHEFSHAATEESH